MWGGGGGGLYTYRYTVTTRMTRALRWAAKSQTTSLFSGLAFTSRWTGTRQLPRVFPPPMHISLGARDQVKSASILTFAVLSREQSMFRFSLSPPPPPPTSPSFSSFSRENSVSLCRVFSSLSPFCLLDSSVMFRFHVFRSVFSRSDGPKAPEWDRRRTLTPSGRTLPACPQGGITCAD